MCYRRACPLYNRLQLPERDTGRYPLVDLSSCRNLSTTALRRDPRLDLYTSLLVPTPDRRTDINVSFELLHRVAFTWARHHLSLRLRNVSLAVVVLRIARAVALDRRCAKTVKTGSPCAQLWCTRIALSMQLGEFHAATGCKRTQTYISSLRYCHLWGRDWVDRWIIVATYCLLLREILCSELFSCLVWIIHFRTFQLNDFSRGFRCAIMFCELIPWHRKVKVEHQNELLVALSQWAVVTPKQRARVGEVRLVAVH